jgi:hypothetical protein
VTDDRGVGFFGAGRSHGERSCHLREPAQRSMDGSVHVAVSLWRCSSGSGPIDRSACFLLSEEPSSTAPRFGESTALRPT